MPEELLDDRLFLTSVYPARVDKNKDGNYETKILYDQEIQDRTWVVIYYRNLSNFPIVQIYHFKTQEEALKYQAIVEPKTPLKSLNGQSPSKPLTYSDYANCKEKNKYKDFHPDRAYKLGGGDRFEIILQTQDQFFDGLRRVNQVFRMEKQGISI
jgi:hypothetical protein